ncbi:MAG: acetylornithine/succinylornithine family transaminase [Planctomycetes bacterium]|nr:acetylornithine/succinylornithine family transaminase [Planctomycetota bacterium]
MSNYGRVPVALVRASGAKLWDSAGAEYIDLFAGFGAAVVGHCHPAVVAAIRKQAGEMMCVGNLFHWQSQLALAESIIGHGFDGRVFYCHSGAEANETALKLARRAAGLGRFKIISFTDCFHGRTMGALSLTSQRKFHDGFEPMLPGCVYLPFGDLDAVSAVIDDQTAGIIVEPIQGEGGVNVPTAEFMRGLRTLCDEHSLSLICDEVWTAPGRTGKWFCYQHYGIEPDIMTLGKACGGGVPVAACVARKGLDAVLTPGSHGCTLGGNPVCAAAGAAVFETIQRENLLRSAVEKGARIEEAIRAANIAAVKDIRGKGLMIGIELDREAKQVFAACLKKGVLVNATAGNVVRLAPPLTISEDELDRGLAVVIEAMK